MLRYSFSFAAALLALIAPQAHAAPTRIPLVIDELRADRTVPWPITTGVPFAEGSLTDENQCRLVDDTGTEQLLQSRVAATWDRARTSIRWLTIDFIAAPGRKYALEFGPEIRRKAPSTKSMIQPGDAPKVDTGRLQALFSLTGPSGLAEIRTDLNADGRYTDDEVVARGSEPGHAYRNQAGISFDSASDGVDRKMVVESAGPVRACVRVDGWYTGPNGERIVAYRTRYHFFAGLELVKQIDEFRVMGSTLDTQFHDISRPLVLAKAAGLRRVVMPSPTGDPPQTIVISQAAAGSIAMSQETYSHYGNHERRGAVTGRSAEDDEVQMKFERVGGWMQAVDDRVAVTGALRWFWQQFPKQWDLQADTLTLRLWSPRAGPLDFGEAGLRKFFGPAGEKYLLDWKGTRSPQTPIENFFFFAGRHALERDGADGLGINKHHEIWHHFAPAARAAEGRQYADLVERRPLCLASGDWNVSTGVFGPLAARPNSSPHEAAVDRIFDLERYAQDAFGDYGWWLFGSGPHYSYQWDKETQKHYADPRRFEYHTYQRETQLWWCYLRSGERKFHDWCFPSENHWVDIAVSHVPTKYSTEWRGGARGDAVLHFAKGDWSIDSPLHYVRHHDTGEAWLRSAPQFWASYHRTLETTSLAYYLTADERYNDVIDYWREYWGALAGVTSATTDVAPHHREQLWFTPTKAGEPAKSWALMLRDYAPFQSGSRHQQTLFFNLSTLYEHTWDPTIAQVVKEYADAFIDPARPNGVWQCQDHHLPSNADSPMLAHYWSPALWKYARATGDPRMPEVLRKYFTACQQADPYGGEVGIYSNNQIAWAWHFTHDPRILPTVRKELKRLQPNAEPLKSPEELGGRIYNPHHPIQVLAAVPRLVGVLEDARRRGIEFPDPPLEPQRTILAFRQSTDRDRPAAVLWGWDEKPAVLRADGAAAPLELTTEQHRSHRQPFDRALVGYKVYRHTLTPATAESTPWIFISPKLEVGLLESSAAGPAWCWAGEAIRIDPGTTWQLPRPAGLSELTIETAQPAQLRINGAPAKAIVKNRITLPLDTDELQLSSAAGFAIWFRLVAPEGTPLWMTPNDGQLGAPPPVPATILKSRIAAPIDVSATYIPGKFGQALVMAPGRELSIPDEAPDAAGTANRLSSDRQGTLEFWVRKLWDDRIELGPRTLEIFDNGTAQGIIPGALPLGEWTHIAVVWRPLSQDPPADSAEPQRTLVHVYVNGIDYATYRNLFWEGYAKPPSFRVREWLKAFIAKCPPGAAYAIDDVRLSSTARYADASLHFSSRQTFNPVTFTPPTIPAPLDASTLWRLPLDNTVEAETQTGKLEGTLKVPTPKK
jgi:hypothetical protein